MDIQLKRGFLDVCVLAAIKNDGRLRKYYRITKAGLGRIEDFKDEWREMMSVYQFVIKGESKDA